MIISLIRGKLRDWRGRHAPASRVKEPVCIDPSIMEVVARSDDIIARAILSRPLEWWRENEGCWDRNHPAHREYTQIMRAATDEVAQEIAEENQP